MSALSLCLTVGGITDVLGHILQPSRQVLHQVVHVRNVALLPKRSESCLRHRPLQSAVIQ